MSLFEKIGVVYTAAAAIVVRRAANVRPIFDAFDESPARIWGALTQSMHKRR